MSKRTLTMPGWNFALKRLALSVCAAGVLSGSATYVVNAQTPALVGSFAIVNNGPGNQTNPHVSCDLASYTSDDFQGSSTIHYYDFVSNTDHVVPGNQVDLLSNVAGAN